MNETEKDKNIFSADYRFGARLNGYDVNMINEIAEPADDDVVKLGVEINKREETIEELRTKIAATERLGRLPEVINLKIKEKVVGNV